MILKESLCFCLLLFSTTVFGFQELPEGKVEYKISLKAGILEKALANDSISKQTKAIFENASDVKGLLYFNKHKGYYLVEPDFWSDLNKSVNITKVFGGGKSVYYDDFANQEHLRLQEVGIDGTNYLVDIPLKEWIITEEKKAIMGYQCTKAYIKDFPDTIAWYAEDIPSKHGPIAHNGLPGLVLMLKNRHVDFVVTKIDLDFDTLPYISKPIGDRALSDEEFREKFKF